MFGTQLTSDRIELGGGLLPRRARSEPSGDDHIADITAVTQWINQERGEDFRIIEEPGSNVGRKNTHDGVRHHVEHDALPENAGTCRELTLPESVREYCHRRRSRETVLGTKSATEYWGQAPHVEKVCGHLDLRDVQRHVEASQVSRAQREPGELLERRGSRAPVGKVGYRGRRSQHDAAAAAFGLHHARVSG